MRPLGFLETPSILRRWLATVKTRLGGVAVARELDAELRTHLEMAVEENLERGMSEREATRAAHRNLGVVSVVREAHHQAVVLLVGALFAAVAVSLLASAITGAWLRSERTSGYRTLAR